METVLEALRTGCAPIAEMAQNPSGEINVLRGRTQARNSPFTKGGVQEGLEVQGQTLLGKKRPRKGQKSWRSDRGERCQSSVHRGNSRGGLKDVSTRKTPGSDFRRGTAMKPNTGRGRDPEASPGTGSRRVSTITSTGKGRFGRGYKRGRGASR